MSKEINIGNVKDFMDKSYFDLEDEDRKSLSYATRDNGSVGEEEYGAEDYRHAVEKKKELLEEFGSDTVSVSLDSCDEWVYINISLKDSK